MKINRLFAVLTAIALMVLVAAGCEKVPIPDTSSTPPVSEGPEETQESPENSEAPVDPEAPVAYFDYEKGYAAFAPDTVLFTAGGIDVTWDDFYYLLGNNVSAASQSLDLSGGWDVPFQGDVPIGKYIIEQATLGMLEEKAILGMAKSMDVSISEEDETAIAQGVESLITENGSEEAVIQLLADNFFMGGIEQYKNYMRTRYILYACFDSMYGENAENLSDEELAEYTKDDGYLMTKHILTMKVSRDESGALVDLPEEERAAAEKKINDILNQLDSFEGADFDTYFNTLMNENSEDTGLAGYPDGYLFQEGDMVPEFYEGTLALEIGEYSQIIESSFGYHIIYRIPINYDSAPSNMQYGLRLLCAEEMFFSALTGWQNNMEVTYSDIYNSLDMSAMFVPNN